MNYVAVSPQFPPYYRNFYIHLRDLGARVLGIGDTPYDLLDSRLKHTLTEYYYVPQMNDYDQMLRACGHFIHKYGRLDRIESLNEHWLETDARLRTDFNVPGLKTIDMEVVKRKSRMKEVFKAAGLDVPRGSLVKSMAEGFILAGELGYPLVIKPDSGVGAQNTQKINDEHELDAFFRDVPEDSEWMLEEFVEGTIYSFDGMVDAAGQPVFWSSLRYNDGVMELVNDSRHTACTTLRQIPDDLREAGFTTIKAFNVQEKFFHFEFFRSNDGKLRALEVNLRPPGGRIIDVMNFANDIDLYFQWANLVINGSIDTFFDWRYHASFITRRTHLNYKLSHDEFITRIGKHLCTHSPVEDVFRGAMGDYVYLVRAEDDTVIQEIVQAGHELNHP